MTTKYNVNFPGQANNNDTKNTVTNHLPKCGQEIHTSHHSRGKVEKPRTLLKTIRPLRGLSRMSEQATRIDGEERRRT